MLLNPSDATRLPEPAILPSEEETFIMNEIAKPKRNRAGIAVSCAVILLLLGFLGTIAAPCYIGSGRSMRNSAVKGNMRTVQIAAESYFSDQGHYPATIAELAPYLPGGAQVANGKAGVFPTNPIDGNTEHSLAISTKIHSAKLIQNARGVYDNAPIKCFPGQVLYCQADGGKSYSVMGADEAGKMLRNGVGQLVLSNQ
jgi:type II secretory pathway pseudopilin PulG